MSRVRGTVQGFGLGLLFAAAALEVGCGGGSGDSTAPPPAGEAGPVDSLVLSLDSADVILGDTMRIRVEPRDANGRVVQGVQLTYASSNTDVATVTGDGLVTAVALGEAEIEVGIAGAAGVASAPTAADFSALLAGQKSKLKLRAVPKVVITPGEQTLAAGATSQYQAVATNSKQQPLPDQSPPVWASSNTSVATIGESGLATAVAGGETQIIASILIGSANTYALAVPLHVTGCEEIFQVATWHAVVDVQYKASGVAEGPLTYIVDQFSTGGATLEKVAAGSGSDSVVWQGKVTGKFTLNNSLTFPANGKNGVTSEIKKDAPIEDGLTAIARLSVKKGSDSRCTYNFGYGDYGTWQVTNNQGAPPIPVTSTLGLALLVGQEVPAPTDGSWRLAGDRVPLPATILQGAGGTVQTGYKVGSYLGISMVGTLGGPGLSFGSAEFLYTITGSK